MNESTPLRASATASGTTESIFARRSSDKLEELMQEGSRMFGQRREATLLFVDLRGSTDLVETLHSEAAYELLGQVMDCLTAEVVNHCGTVIDYFGDGLAAMWNAPTEQDDHAARACRAALGMIASLPAVSADWKSILNGSELRLGIGIHSGIVQVGNSGSRRVKKYGPRGASVHLASRVEAATKAIGLPLILTAPTVTRLPSSFATYRICRAELPGIDDPIDLYGLLPTHTNAEQTAAIESYSRGLALCDEAKFEEARRTVTTVPDTSSLPKQFLLRHIEQRLGQQNRRRSSDPSEAGNHGVIRIDPK